MNFLKIYSDRFQDTWDSPALTCHETGLTLTYGSLAARMMRIHILFEEIGVVRGSRVAVVGSNTIDWVTIYMAGLTYGATMVTLPATLPIDDVMKLLGDVDTQFLFIDADLFPGAGCMAVMPSMQLVISTDTQRVLARRFYSVADPESILKNLDIQFINRFPYGFQPRHAVAPELAPDDVIAIFFTAGTTGRPRGVMLMADNLEGNVIHGIKNYVQPSGTKSLMVTNLGNVWTTVYNLLVPLASGAHIVLFRDVTNPAILIEVMEKVRPNRLLLTPRKVGWLYDATLRRLSKKKYYRLLVDKCRSSVVKRLAIRHMFNKITGGRCKELSIFSYALGPLLSQNLQNVGIRYTQSYGLAECGGLISYASSADYTPGTSGRILRNTAKCRLRPIEIDGLPEDAGLLEVSGMTVMNGYVDDELNKDVFTRDNWFRTGDIATISPRGDLTILGRFNTLINRDGNIIVPEKLALILMDQPYVQLAVVVMRGGMLTAVVQPDHERIQADFGVDASVESIMKNAVSDLNRLTSLHERVEKVEVSEEPMYKTIKHTAARYRYE